MSLADTFRDDIERAKQKHLAEIERRFGSEVIADPRFHRAVTLTHATMEANTLEKLINEVLKNASFLRACTEVGLEPSRRQAKKFYKGEGAAWKLFLKHGASWVRNENSTIGE